MYLDVALDVVLDVSYLATGRVVSPIERHVGVVPVGDQLPEVGDCVVHGSNSLQKSYINKDHLSAFN